MKEDKQIFNSIYKFNIFAVDKKITIQEPSQNPLHKYIETIIDTKDKAIIEKLIELGWTPPDEKRICENCKYMTKFPIFHMICQRGGNEYNPLFEVDVFPEFGCIKWERKE